MMYEQIGVDKIISATVKDGYGNVLIDLLTGEELVEVECRVMACDRVNRNYSYISKEVLERSLKDANTKNRGFEGSNEGI